MRTVVETAEVMAEVDDAEVRWGRAAEAWSTVTWVLSRDPTVGMPLVEGGQQRSIVFDGSRAHDMPTIQVLYEITATEIVIRKVRFLDAQSSAGNA
jgi:hypothetical protein